MIAPAADALPVSHAVHDDWPAVAINVPAAHGLHSVAPAASEIVPAGQSVHVSDPAVENLPATHFVHDVAADPAYVPAAHGRHVWPVF